MRVLLTVEYDGTAYSGWQRQSNAVSVQEKIEDAICALTGVRVGVTGASRTDAGVHALGQRVHFDNPGRIPAERYALALNTCLPPDIRVTDSREVPDDFHARFCAKGKRYRYLILNRNHAGALTRNTHMHVSFALDAEKMHREAQALIGTHDFKAFAASGSVVKDTVRTITAASVTRTGDEIRIEVEGTGFLYNMVRIIAGTLTYVGQSKLPEGTLARAIETGDRLDLGITAPAHGLTLMEVFYDL